MGGDGNRAMVAVFSFFPIWILCEWWWDVLVLSGGGWQLVCVSFF